MDKHCEHYGPSRGLSRIQYNFTCLPPRYLQLGPIISGINFPCSPGPYRLSLPILGWVRDRFGVRYLTTAGWVLFCPLLCCLGVPGRVISSASDSRRTEKVSFIACIYGIGLVMPFV
ncbi:uncharacterized protein ANIA_11014 [Aspergillus nidulans FGSC A4]|uniref:Uncharacterized protein n=1 Tax=Emericella nidulans (strain FGSC A4 / ATCC 38163 / CBS 112.46 / NRRL 194 / M139) TaxID=227321 RepID=C8VDS3_EMENI|nr:hypothetical protein [Aspergillus nidulans FGSC A4]CBF80136.1 TPA: hypothetical protein ANIA_11014 [Aspergillus nidulans FGSC A4]